MEMEPSGLSEKFDLSTTLVKLRHDRGLSQRDLAELAGVSNAEVSHIETGRQTPNPGILTLTRIANAMGLSILEFIEQSLIKPEES